MERQKTRCIFSHRQLKRLVSAGILEKIEIPFSREILDIFDLKMPLDECRFLVFEGKVVYNTLYGGVRS